MTAALSNIHDLTTIDRASLMRAAWQQQSRFQKEFGKDWTDLPAASFGTQLAAQIVRLLREKRVIAKDVPLTLLHEHLSDELKAYNFDDGVNKVSTFLYDTDEQFTSLYHRFIKECLQKHFPYPFYFQATPTIRIHCPDGKNNNHYPRYHSDIGYGHPPEEINLWLPLTEPQPPQHHGFRVTDIAHSRTILDAFDYDFQPFIKRVIEDKPYNLTLDKVAPQVTTKLDSVFAFDSRCIHTGEPLLNHSRASMDIRIIPVADYAALPVEYQGTGRKRIRYIPGQAYHPLSSDKL